MATKNFALLSFALEQGERPRVRIQGKSMLPTLRDGMVAEVELLPNDPRAGDIFVYDIGGLLVAHRFIGCLSHERLLLCGDAHPKVIEHISRKHVLGRVSRIWQSDAPNAPEVSPLRLRFLGGLMLRSRALRATGLRTNELFGYLARHKQSTNFASMNLALFYLLNERWAEGAALINAFDTRAFFDIASRHGLGGIVFRLAERANAAGHAIRADLVQGVRSGRWASAIRADEIIARAADVQRELSGVGIEPIFLKGAARLLRADVDADIHYSNDVDVIVPDAVADAAVEALRADGYDHHASASDRVLYRRWRQHRAPLWNSDAVVPIEVHTRLCIPGSVSQGYDYERLLPFSELVDSSIGQVRVLNRVGSAIHLAYHGREGRVLRDLYLLAQLLREMNDAEYAQFMQLVRSERRDHIRIASAVALAHRFAGRSIELPNQQRRYLSWLSFREDLPLMFKKRGHILEGSYARCLPPYQGVRHVGGHVYTWIYNLAATPLIIAWYRRYHETCAKSVLARVFE